MLRIRVDSVLIPDSGPESITFGVAQLLHYYRKWLGRQEEGWWMYDHYPFGRPLFSRWVSQESG